MTYSEAIAERHSKYAKDAVKVAKQKAAMLKAAMDIDELAYDLGNISTDDRKQIEDYTQAEVVHEAKYVLEKFHDEIGGHWNNEDLRGENGEQQQKWARGEVRKLKAFIKKYDDVFTGVQIVF